MDGTADLQTFENKLSSDGLYGSVWVTEAGVQLDNDTGDDQNYPNGAGCTQTESDQLVFDKNLGRNVVNFGACVEGSQSRQYSYAHDWINLGNVSASGVSTAEVNWYQYRLQNGSHHWDSAISVIDPFDQTEHLRPAWCTLYGTSDTCESNAGLLSDFNDPTN